MSKRSKVYAAIDGERDYQEARWKHTCTVEGKHYIPDSDKTTEMYLSFIAGYNQDLLHAISHKAGVEDALDVFRKLAGLCVACMEFNGGYFRNVKTTGRGPFMQPVLKRTEVYKMIDTERIYQDNLSALRTDGRQHSVSGYVIMFQHYLDIAYSQWTDNAGDRQCLDVIRKLAGIAVHCLEDHGSVLREPFQV